MLLLLFNFAFAEPTCGPNSAPTLPAVELERRQVRERARLGAEKNVKTFKTSVRGQEIPVRYVRYPAPRRPSRGTIVSLCGGPGFSCVTGGRQRDLPDDYDVVTLDYLGIGQNGWVTEPERMSIEAQGEAVAGLVRQLDDPGVVLYGHSFGTAVATVAAAELTKDRAPANLKGVVLEGVVGPKGGSRYGDGFVAAAEHAWSKLSAGERASFAKRYEDTIRGLTPRERAIVDGALNDTITLGTEATLKTLRTLKRDPTKSKVRPLAGTNADEPSNPEQYRAAGCQINDQYAPPVRLFGGLVPFTLAIEPGAKTPCDCPSVSRAWNPNAFQIRGVPVVYVNGEQDPQTPLAWARAHHDGQKTSRKIFFATEGGGHSESDVGRIAPCTGMIYYGLFVGPFERMESHRDEILNGTCLNGPASRPPPASRTSR